MVFIINIEAQIRWLLRIYSFCLLENSNVRLCVFHKLIAKKERKTENKEASCLVPATSGNFLYLSSEPLLNKKQILLTSQLKKARHIPASDRAR